MADLREIKTNWSKEKGKDKVRIGALSFPFRKAAFEMPKLFYMVYMSSSDRSEGR